MFFFCQAMEDSDNLQGGQPGGDSATEKELFNEKLRVELMGLVSGNSVQVSYAAPGAITLPIDDLTLMADRGELFIFVATFFF